jgi:hypothetical protein
MVRTMFCEAAHIMLVRSTRWSWLRVLGDEDCQDTLAEEGGRGAGTQARSDHAPHVGGWHRVPMDPGRNGSMRVESEQ